MKGKRCNANMKTREALIYSVIIVSLLCGDLTAESPSDEELEVNLQFFEFDLEDLCVLKSEVEWQYLTGNKSDLKELWQLELKEADLYKNESKMLQRYRGKKFFNDRLERLFNIFSYPGAQLLGSSELREYKQYSVKLIEINSEMSIGCRQRERSVAEPNEATEVDEKCVPANKRQVNKILSREKNEDTLRSIWTEWFQELEFQNRRTNFDFIQKLSILDIEAEQNEEDDLSDYWLKQSDIEGLDYQNLLEFWKELTPLYESLKNYIAKLLEKSYGNNIFIKGKFFPIHLLGSLEPKSWISAAERLGAFDHSKSYQILKSNLAEKSMESLFEMADNITSQFGMGDLPAIFYKNSNFNVSSRVCTSKVLDYCSRKNVVRAIGCSDEDVTISRFIEVHEEVTKLKHIMFAGKELPEEENGYYFREGPRDSVIYEAMSGLSSVIAMRPNNLRQQNLLPDADASLLHDEEMMSLLISALDTLPSLPYYLAADLWRINALREMDESAGEMAYESTTSFTMSSSTSLTSSSEEDSSSEVEKSKNEMAEATKEGESTTNDGTEAERGTIPPNVPQSTPSTANSIRVYDIKNLTADWWKFREEFQGIAHTDGQLHLDFLQDEKIIWNKPYVSKFLGKIVQFQLLSCFRQENASTNAIMIQSLLLKGKSKPFQKILAELFDITQISTMPLLQYFTPLKNFLDSGGKFGKEHADLDNFILFPDSFSMNPQSTNQGETQKSSNTVAFSILILVSLGLVGVSVFVALSRYLAKRRTKRRRKCLTELKN